MPGWSMAWFSIDEGNNDLERFLRYLFSGRLDACLRAVEQVDRRILFLEPEDTFIQMAKVNAIRCSIACFQNDLPRAEELAEKAFKDLPREEHFIFDPLSTDRLAIPIAATGAGNKPGSATIACSSSFTSLPFGCHPLTCSAPRPTLNCDRAVCSLLTVIYGGHWMRLRIRAVGAGCR